MTAATLEARYEHVTVRNEGGFSPASPDAFAAHLSRCVHGAAAVFVNLGGDAVLVAPAPCEPRHVYGHLAAFTRGAALQQQLQLWQAVGRALAQTLDERGGAPIWLNTEGSGVPWLHVRMDSSPKYYHYDAYRRG